VTLRALGRPALAAALVLGLAAGCAGVRKAPATDGWTSRAFSVQGHGRLLVRLPPGWTAAEGEEGEAGVPSIRLTQPGERFLVLLTPLWNPGEPESPEARADTAQLFAELGRRRALAGAVEQEIALEELSGPGVRGAYFSATDRDLEGKDPGPDEYRHVLQGAAAVGPVIVAFTLLDDGPGAWRDLTLDLVRTARHVPDGGAEGAAPLQPLPDVETAPLRVGLPGRSWAVLVDLPGFEVARVAPAKAAPDAVHVLGRSPESDVVISVLLSPAGSARDAEGCREQALKRIRRAVTGIEDLRRAEGGGSAAATYALPSGPTGRPEWHAHAFLWREGVCASLHASKAEPGPEDAGLLDAILSSFRIAEDL
jgi:hypothetical protein